MRNLELTESDFKLMIDGLDALPEKGIASDMMGFMLDGLLADKNPEAADKRVRERELKAKTEDSKKEELRENIKILQGKLLMLKRYLIEIDGLKQVNEILK